MFAVIDMTQDAATIVVHRHHGSDPRSCMRVSGRRYADASICGRVGVGGRRAFRRGDGRASGGVWGCWDRAGAGASAPLPRCAFGQAGWRAREDRPAGSGVRQLQPVLARQHRDPGGAPDQAQTQNGELSDAPDRPPRHGGTPGGRDGRLRRGGGAAPPACSIACRRASGFRGVARCRPAPRPGGAATRRSAARPDGKAVNRRRCAPGPRSRPRAASHAAVHGGWMRTKSRSAGDRRAARATERRW